jgi:photosynthetic reaction center cytochrome c subunit
MNPAKSRRHNNPVCEKRQIGRSKAALILVVSVGLVPIASAIMRAWAAGAGVQLGPNLTPQQVEGKKAEEVYKNIQVLKGVSADQIVPAMQFITTSLGVECDYCHVRDVFDKDDKLPKDTARKMMRMMFAINKDSFEGKRELTCYSCHHGAREPAPTPVLSEIGPPPMAPVATQPAALPAGSALIDKYVQALGGAEPLAKITSRVEKGKIIPAGDEQCPVEIYAKAPGKRMSVMHMSDGDHITAFDGQTGWFRDAGNPPREMFAPEAEGAKLDADFYLATDLKRLYNQFRVFPPEKVGNADAYLVLAHAEGKPPLRLYFDKENGLLVRLIRYQDTPLGMNPVQIDYADYRAVGGTKVAFRWTLTRPAGQFTIQVETVEQNVSVDDAKFRESVTK